VEHHKHHGRVVAGISLLYGSAEDNEMRSDNQHE
jgi:hypothetical protein